MPHRLRKNAPVQALPVKVQAFSFMLIRAFVVADFDCLYAVYGGDKHLAASYPVGASPLAMWGQRHLWCFGRVWR
ncbi:hypothetical protein AAX10_10230 [Moraxella bovoculi]|nr:hypothetical protein AAX10_10230 [Moraxella bovoculi]